jgi:hypothetical protein
MKKVILILSTIFIAKISLSQNISEQQWKILEEIENKEMKANAFSMLRDSDVIQRYRADSFFTRSLVKALRTPNSFYYPFDSIVTVSKVYAPDSTFRIFTWELVKDSVSCRQKGAIQMRTADGSLKLFPLLDNSDESQRPVDSVRNTQRWIGAIYYKIILTTFNNKNYYTLLGFDDNNNITSKKWIEVLTFDNTGQPQFGGRFFQYANDEIKPQQPAFRFCLEYKKEGRARMNYDPEMDAIIFDHLISEDKKPAKRETLVPDGDYEAFKWKDGKWVHVSKVFDYKADMNGVDPMKGNPPVPAPIKQAEEETPKKKKKGKGN